MLDSNCLVREEWAGNRHSDLLLPMVSSLLAEAGLALNQLDGIAFGKGPGSFTGLRIGCGVVQGLAFGADLPVLGVISLEAMAWSTGAKRVVTCLDARMNEVYSAIYERVTGKLVCRMEPGVYNPEQVPRPEGDGWLGCGNGFSAYTEALSERFVDHLVEVRPDTYPHAKAIAELAWPAFQAGEGLPPDRAEPLYVRDKVALKTCER